MTEVNPPDRPDQAERTEPAPPAADPPECHAEVARTESALAAMEPIEIQRELERSSVDDAMPVIVSRALPAARDGLQPVHRRILWGMRDVGARSDRPHMKCARIT